MTRRALTAVGTLTAVAAVVAFVATRPEGALRAQADTAQDTVPYKAPVDVDTAGLPGPVQPIFYRHDVHAGEYQMDCRYCHFAVEVSSSAGLPTVSQCMGCHIIAGAANPEVQKLREYWNDRRPIEWIEIHVLSPFVRFPHSRHVHSEQGSFKDLEIVEKCEACHGPIRRMPQVYQHASLKMGWCITCHEEEDVTTDCTVCHY
jgi:hypothetical protein